MAELTYNLLRCIFDILMLTDEIESPYSKGNIYFHLIIIAFQKITSSNPMKFYNMLYSPEVQRILKNYEKQVGSKNFEIHRISFLFLTILEIKLNEYINYDISKEEAVIHDLVVDIKKGIENNFQNTLCDVPKLDIDDKIFKIFEYPDRGKLNNIQYIKKKLEDNKLRCLILDYDLSFIMEKFDDVKSKVFTLIKEEIKNGIFCFPSASMCSYLANKLVFQFDIYKYLDYENLAINEIKFLESCIISDSLVNIVKTNKMDEFILIYNRSHNYKMDKKTFECNYKHFVKNKSLDCEILLSLKDIIDYYPYMFIDWNEYWRKTIKKYFSYNFYCKIKW